MKNATNLPPCTSPTTGSGTISFADVAHQTLIFDRADPTAQLVLQLVDTRWVQRLRRIRQTGNTYLVYMFSEHSRFGHSLGVSYLALELMKHLRTQAPQLVAGYQDAVAAAALLHDIGHVAPGSHLAATMWAPAAHDQHESVSCRVIREDREINQILSKHSEKLPELVAKILDEDESTPPWARAVISGGGWNADRGNWTIVDSAMCSVSYGRYNVRALIEAFQLSNNGELVLHESRLDALTHFFVARDSMYRQVYQHRVLQAADALTNSIVQRLRDIMAGAEDATSEYLQELLRGEGVFCDSTLAEVLSSKNYAVDLPLETVFQMTEDWWAYHLNAWCSSRDSIIRDLSQRLRDRRLFKTIRIDLEADGLQEMVQDVKQLAQKLGFDPKYYVTSIESADRHRGTEEQAPLVLRDNGELVAVTEVEPLIGALLERPSTRRAWLAVPKEVKEKLGRAR